MRTLTPTLRMTQARFLLSLLDEPLQSKPLGVNVEGSATIEVEQPQVESHADTSPWNSVEDLVHVPSICIAPWAAGASMRQGMAVPRWANTNPTAETITPPEEFVFSMCKKQQFSPSQQRPAGRCLHMPLGSNPEENR